MEIIFNNKVISDISPVFIIAEGCDNHLGNIDTAMRMAYEAKKSGANAIKFQHHLPNEEMLKDTPSSDNFNEPLYEFLQNNILSLNEHEKLKEYCDSLNILYLCTPFSYKAAVEINHLVPLFKIGSGEMTDIPTLEKIADFKKPIIISTGMSSFDEINKTYNAMISKKVSLALLNCVSEYPPLYEDLNLGVIPLMKSKFSSAIIGHSDHTPDIYTSFAAVALGAKIIEKHVILDKTQPGPDQSVSIEFNELQSLVQGIRKIEVALGSEKKVHNKEQDIRSWAFRSIVSIKNINKGDYLTEINIWSKRPGTGIPSHKMNEVLGTKAKKYIPVNSLISFDDIE